MRRALPLLALLALAGCDRPLDTPVSFVPCGAATQLGCRFDAPAGWPATVRRKSGQTFVVLQPRPTERLVLTRLPADASTPLDALAARTEQEVQAKQPTARTGHPTDATVAGRPARAVPFTLASGSQGRRYVITGGWVLEWEAEPRDLAAAQAGFEQVVRTLALP